MTTATSPSDAGRASATASSASTQRQGAGAVGLAVDLGDAGVVRDQFLGRAPLRCVTGGGVADPVGIDGVAGLEAGRVLAGLEREADDDLVLAETVVLGEHRPDEDGALDEVGGGHQSLPLHDVALAPQHVVHARLLGDHDRPHGVLGDGLSRRHTLGELDRLDPVARPQHEHGRTERPRQHEEGGERGEPRLALAGRGGKAVSCHGPDRGRLLRSRRYPVLCPHATNPAITEFPAGTSPVSAHASRKEAI
jgi:hypothetical protein